MEKCTYPNCNEATWLPLCEKHTKSEWKSIERACYKRIINSLIAYMGKSQAIETQEIIQKLNAKLEKELERN